MIHTMMEITIIASIPSSLNPMPKLVARANRNSTMALTANRKPIFNHFPAELKSAIFRFISAISTKDFLPNFQQER